MGINNLIKKELIEKTEIKNKISEIYGKNKINENNIIKLIELILKRIILTKTINKKEEEIYNINIEEELKKTIKNNKKEILLEILINEIKIMEELYVINLQISSLY